MSEDQARNAKAFNEVRDFGAAALVDRAVWRSAREESWVAVPRVRGRRTCDFCWKPIAVSAWLSTDRGVYEHLHCRRLGFEAERRWREYVEAREAAIRGVRFGTREVQPLQGFEQEDPRELVLDPPPDLLEIDVRDYAGRLAIDGWQVPIGISPARAVRRGDRQVVAALFLGLQLVPIEVLAGEASQEVAA